MARLPVWVSGSLIALIGFILTRFTVTLAATETTVQFLFAGIIPLLLGLSLSAFGVILAVSSYSREYVQTTAMWALLGTLTMFMLVVLTILGTQPEALTDLSQAREQTYLSNFLIGGAIGGTLTGLYAAENRHQRTSLEQQANRLILLNRLLRDKVINAATAIKGHKELLETDYEQQSIDVVGQKADDVIEIVENIKYLSETADESSTAVGPTDLSTIVREEFERVEDSYPAADCSCSIPEQSIQVLANSKLREAFRHLFENAITYSGTNPELAVRVEVNRGTATVHVTDNGRGLPHEQQELLESGTIAEYDDPNTGFGLNIVRLLVESYDGDIDTDVSDTGSRISVRLPLVERMARRTPATETRLPAPTVPKSHIALAIGAALVAGATMATAMVTSGGDFPSIGALYGIENLPVALITHEFHSIVFGLGFAGAVSILPATYTRDVRHLVVVGVCLGLLLWIMAAGIIMPLWLRLVGVETALPNLTVPSLLGHVVWGLTMSSLYFAGDVLIRSSKIRE